MTQPHNPPKAGVPNKTGIREEIAKKLCKWSTHKWTNLNDYGKEMFMKRADAILAAVARLVEERREKAKQYPMQFSGYAPRDANWGYDKALEDVLKYLEAHD